jgi:hypothetical protein
MAGFFISGVQLKNPMKDAAIIIVAIACIANAANCWQIKGRLSAVEKEQQQMRLLLQSRQSASTCPVAPSSARSTP